MHRRAPAGSTRSARRRSPFHQPAAPRGYAAIRSCAGFHRDRREARRPVRRRSVAGVRAAGATPKPKQALAANFYRPRSWRLSIVGSRSFEPVGNTALGQIIGSHFHKNLVAGEDADSILAHLSGGVRDDLMVVFELDAKGRIREQFDDGPWKFEQFFLRHLFP